MVAPYPVSFRAPEPADVPIMLAWRHAEHVQRWWDLPASDADLVSEMITHTDTWHGPQRYIVCYDDQPLGFIQGYRLAAWPEYQASIGLADDTAGVDMFIGDVVYLHRGLGAAILQCFVSTIVFTWAGITTCVIGPDPENIDAIKAYRKAGFYHLKTVAIPFLGERQYLMGASREALIPHFA